MCEANAHLIADGIEFMISASVDRVVPEVDGGHRLVNIFGEQRIIKGNIEEMKLAEHRIVFEG